MDVQGGEGKYSWVGELIQLCLPRCPHHASIRQWPGRVVSPAPGRGGAEGNHPGLGAGGRVTGLCVWGGCGGWKQFEEKLPSGRSLSTSPQAFRKALWLSPKPGTQKSQGFRFLSVILASLLSGSIDDVLGDLLGDDSKCRLTRVGGGA